MSDRSAELMAQWCHGDQQAAQEWFRCYAEKLIALTRARLSAKLARRIDAEDVVQSACRSFFVGIRDGRYEWEHGSDLWRLLVGITINKLQRQVEFHTAEKRSIQREQAIGGEDDGAGLTTLTREPSPLEAAALVDQLAQATHDMDPLYRRMVELRLQGYSIEEIAEDTCRSERTVRRVLDRVKQQLELRE